MRLEGKHKLKFTMRPRTDLQGSAVCLRDGAAHGKPESHAGRLAGDEGLEQPFALLLRNARPVHAPPADKLLALLE